MTGSASEPFEATHPLPIGDGGVVGRQLDPRVVEVVRRRPRRRRPPGRPPTARTARPPRAASTARAAHRDVGVAREHRLELELVLDAVEPARDDRGDGEVLVDVAAGHAVLDPQRRPVPDDAQRAGAVVEAPGDGGRREAALDVALVRVDVRARRTASARASWRAGRRSSAPPASRSRARRRRPSPARPSSPRTERWMWQLLPSRSLNLAMKVSALPCWSAISFAPFL